MEVVDTKKLEIAIQYLQRITEGHNPVNNIPVDDDSVIKNPNVVRCMLFIKDVLEEVKQNDGYIGRRPRTKKDNSKKNDSKKEYPLQALKNFRYSEDKSVSRLVDQFNGLTDLTVFQKLTYKPIIAWLKQNGYLRDEQDEGTSKKRTLVTEKGSEVGIKSELRKDSKGQEFIYITYSRTAQEFIVSNMDKILSLDAMRKASG